MTPSDLFWCISVRFTPHRRKVSAGSRLHSLPLGLLCKPQPEPGPSQCGCWWCPPSSPVPPPKPPDKIPFWQTQGKFPQQLQTCLPLVPHALWQQLPVRSYTLLHTVLVSCFEKQTHLCSNLHLTAGDACSVTSFSEFVLHGHKLGNKMFLPSLCVSREPQEGFLIASLQL